MSRQEQWWAHWFIPLREAHTLAYVAPRILVKSLDFKLEVVADALVNTLPHSPAGSEATTLQNRQGGV